VTCPTEPPGAGDPLWSLAAARRAWSASGLRVVLTNGCFDLLHVGHVRYLAAARALGDVLVVAVNDDASTSRLKGPRRPLVPLVQRMEVLAALRMVDAVVSFDEDTAVGVVRALLPDVYVKGGDYDGALARPPEADAAAACGAEVVFVPFETGHSTSALAERIARRWS